MKKYEEGKLNTLSADMFDYDRTDKYIEDIDGYIYRKMQELSEVNAAIKALTKKDQRLRLRPSRRF